MMSEQSSEILTDPRSARLLSCVQFVLHEEDACDLEGRPVTTEVRAALEDVENSITRLVGVIDRLHEQRCRERGR
jgi:hypothetical protein